MVGSRLGTNDMEYLTELGRYICVSVSPVLGEWSFFWTSRLCADESNFFGPYVNTADIMYCFLCIPYRMLVLCTSSR